MFSVIDPAIVATCVSNLRFRVNHTSLLAISLILAA
jgi:hypothetical protein